MENQEKENQNNEEELIKVVREEYEKKIANLLEEHKKELEKVRQEEHEKSVKTIRALMSGKETNEIYENPAPENEISFEEQLLIDTRKNFGLDKGGN